MVAQDEFENARNVEETIMKMFQEWVHWMNAGKRGRLKVIDSFNFEKVSCHLNDLLTQ